jgi:hypothetical protein
MGVGVAHFYFSYYLCVRDDPANKKNKMKIGKQRSVTLK